MIEQVARDQMQLGLHGPAVLKSDQEAAIVDLLREVARARGSNRTVLEQSPVGDPAGNGVAEGAVQSIEKLVRPTSLL